MLLRTIICGIALLSFFSTSDSFASSSAYCKIFSRTVYSLQSDNRRYKCNLRGADWTNPRAIAIWCSRTHSSTVTQRLNRMKRQMDGCRRCNPYAKKSFQQHILNLRNRCHFKGTDWTADQRVHHRWCMRRSKSQTDAKIRQRTAALVACGRRYRSATCGKQRKEFDAMKVKAKRMGCFAHFHNRWKISSQALYTRCMKAEFGLSLFKDYRADMKRCGRCYLYTRKMTTLGRATRRYKCALRLGVYSTHYMNGCMKEPLHKSHNRLVSSQRKTNICMCNYYAKDAVRAAQFNRNYRCGLEKGNYGSFGRGSNVWSSNFNWHYRWCLVTLRRSTLQMNRAITLRRRSIATCRRKKRR